MALARHVSSLFYEATRQRRGPSVIRTSWEAKRLLRPKKGQARRIATAWKIRGIEIIVSGLAVNASASCRVASTFLARSDAVSDDTVCNCPERQATVCLALPERPKGCARPVSTLTKPALSMRSCSCRPFEGITAVPTRGFDIEVVRPRDGGAVAIREPTAVRAACSRERVAFRLWEAARPSSAMARARGVGGLSRARLLSIPASWYA
jgi:hypothetical protein